LSTFASRTEESHHQPIEIPHVHLRRHLESRVHRQQRHAEVDDFHVGRGHESSDCPADAYVNLWSLRLPGTLLLIQQCSYLCYELGIRIEAVSVSLDGHSEAQPRSVRGLTCLRKDRVHSVVAVGRNDLRIS